MTVMLRNTVEVYGTVPAVGISYWFRKRGRGISIVDIVLRASHSTLKYLVIEEYFSQF
jgi:acylphosphatase